MIFIDVDTRYTILHTWFRKFPHNRNEVCCVSKNLHFCGLEILEKYVKISNQYTTAYFTFYWFYTSKHWTEDKSRISTVLDVISTVWISVCRVDRQGPSHGLSWQHSLCFTHTAHNYIALSWVKLTCPQTLRNISVIHTYCLFCLWGPSI